MAPKRKSKSNSVELVVTAVTEAESLPADLRSLLAKILPAILETNKADRHPFQAEVVVQVQEALGTVEKSLEAAHKDALAKQTAIVSPDERTKREAAEKDAEEKQKQAHEHVDASDASKKEADKSVHDAEQAIKAAKKDETAAEKVMQSAAKKKSSLETAIADGFDTMAIHPKSPQEVKLLCGYGTEYGVGGTCLQAFQLACKTPALSRSEFETKTINTVKEKLDAALVELSKNLEDESAVLESKKAATNAAKETLTAAQATQKEAGEKLAAAKEALKEAKKNVSQAISFRQKVWEEIKAACDAQDELAKEVKKIKEIVLPAFEEAKEKAPAPEPVVEEPPAEEPPEKKQKTDEAAAEAEAPVPEASAE